MPIKLHVKHSTIETAGTIKFEENLWRYWNYWNASIKYIGYLQGILLQVVRFPEARVLDVVREAAAFIVPVVQHHPLQLAVQDVDAEREREREIMAT